VTATMQIPGRTELQIP